MTRAMGLAPGRAETRNAAQGEARRPGDAEGGRRPNLPRIVSDDITVVDVNLTDYRKESPTWVQ